MRKGRVTVTLDQSLIDLGNAAVAAGRAESLSAWINDVLAERSEKERRLAAMSELLAEYQAEHGAFTPEEMAEHERETRRTAVVVRGGRIFRPKKQRSRAR